MSLDLGCEKRQLNPMVRMCSWRLALGPPWGPRDINIGSQTVARPRTLRHCETANPGHPGLCDVVRVSPTQQKHPPVCSAPGAHGARGQSSSRERGGDWPPALCSRAQRGVEPLRCGRACHCPPADYSPPWLPAPSTPAQMKLGREWSCQILIIATFLKKHPLSKLRNSRGLRSNQRQRKELMLAQCSWQQRQLRQFLLKGIRHPGSEKRWPDAPKIRAGGEKNAQWLTKEKSYQS